MIPWPAAVLAAVIAFVLGLVIATDRQRNLNPPFVGVQYVPDNQWEEWRDQERVDSV